MHRVRLPAFHQLDRVHGLEAGSFLIKWVVVDAADLNSTDPTRLRGATQPVERPGCRSIPGCQSNLVPVSPGCLKCAKLAYQRIAKNNDLLCDLAVFAPSCRAVSLCEKEAPSYTIRFAVADFHTTAAMLSVRTPRIFGNLVLRSPNAPRSEISVLLCGTLGRQWGGIPLQS